jgi:integrase
MARTGNTGSVEKVVGKDGRVRYRAIGSYQNPLTKKQVRVKRTFDSQREAWVFVEALKAQAKEKATAGAAGTVGKKTWTLAEWLTEWLQLIKGKVEEGTWKWYEQKVRLCLLPVVGKLELDDRLTPLEVERLFAEMRGGGMGLKKPVSVYMQRAALTTLRTALNKAVKHLIIKQNPTQPVQKPKKEHREPTWWTAAEAAAFLAAPVVIGHRHFALFRLALDSGARQGELFGLHWPDVAFETATVEVRRSLEEVDGVLKLKKPKTGRQRRVIISGETVNALAEHRKRMLAEGRDVKTGPVFVNEAGNWLTKSDYYKTWCRLVKRAAAPPMRPYDTRHSCASMLLADGASIRAVSDRLGHKDPSMTLRVYAHCLPSDQEKLAAAAGKLLAAPAAKAQGM